MHRAWAIFVAIVSVHGAAHLKASGGSDCASQSKVSTLLVQTKLAVLGDVCEKMCKRLGSYPKCDCPGFGGRKADDTGERSCYDNHCKDPSNPCMGGGDAGDHFVTCVEGRTAVSPAMLQWDDVMETFDRRSEDILRQLRKH